MRTTERRSGVVYPRHIHGVLKLRHIQGALELRREDQGLFILGIFKEYLN